MRRVLENLGLWTATLIALTTMACADERADTKSDAQQSVQPTASGALTRATTPTPTPDTTDISDDHVNRKASAADISVGEPIELSLDYIGDVEYFRFDAEANLVYRIDIDSAPSTEPGPGVAIYDSNGEYSGGGGGLWDDDGTGIIWKAPQSGSYYAEINAGFVHEIGLHTLTVALTDITDDYADHATDATVAAIGKPVKGSVDYKGDVDCFRFQAEAGQFYRIYVTLGASWHAEAVLYDSKGNLLGDDNDDITSGLEIIWLARDSGEYYVGVTSIDNNVIVKQGLPLSSLPCEWSYGVSGEGGAYTLTIDPIDVTEDHANVKENATFVALGDAVEGSLEYERDTDYFRFHAKAEKVYRIVVRLGTLEELWIGLEDTDGDWLISSYYGRSPALRLDWYAQSTGDYYLTVSSHYMKRMGTYTLTINPN